MTIGRIGTHQMLRRHDGAEALRMGRPYRLSKRGLMRMKLHCKNTPPRLSPEIRTQSNVSLVQLSNNDDNRRAKRSRNDLRTSSPPRTPSKLEELPQAILNRLTPSNIKATTANFIKDWERSLSPPHPTSSETGSPPFPGDPL
jgi:hypothetical protein